MKKLITLVFVLLMVGCMQAPQTDLEGFKAMRDVWQSAYDSKDPAAIAAIYAEDGRLMSPNSETISSQAAIEAYLTESLATQEPEPEPEPEPEDEAEVADEV